MKRMIPLLCALVMLLAGCVPVLAASEDRPYYPISVEESFEGDVDAYRIKKVYQLSLSDDPANIPMQDFERNGYTFRLLDMTRRDDVGIDTMPWVETVTKASDTNDLEKILQMLDAEIEVTTEDGYAGALRLDHTSVQVTVDGYATKTRALSAKPLPWLGHALGRAVHRHGGGRQHVGDDPPLRAGLLRLRRLGVL